MVTKQAEVTPREIEHFCSQTRDRLSVLKKELCACPEKLAQAKQRGSAGEIHQAKQVERDLHGQALDLATNGREQLQARLEEVKPVLLQKIDQAEAETKAAKADLEQLKREQEKHLRAATERITSAEKAHVAALGNWQQVSQTMIAFRAELTQQIEESAEMV